MSHLLECKRIGNANVMLYMQFDAQQNGAGSTMSHCQFTPDKWLSLSNWSAVLADLETFAAANLHATIPAAATGASATSAAHLKGKTIHRSQLTYSADWLELNACPAGKLAAQLLTHSPGTYFDLHPYFVHVRVQPSKEDKLARHIAELEDKIKDLKRSKKTSASSASSNGSRSAAPTVAPEVRSIKRSVSHKSDSARAASDVKKEPVVPDTDKTTAKPTKSRPSADEGGDAVAASDVGSKKKGHSSSKPSEPKKTASPSPPDSEKSSGDRKRTLSTDMFADDEVVTVPDSQSPSSGLQPPSTTAAAEHSDHSGRPQRSRRAMHANLSENTLSPRIVVPAAKRSKPDASEAIRKPKAAAAAGAKLARSSSKEKPRRKAEPPIPELLSPESYLCRLTIPQMDALRVKRQAEIEEMKQMCDRMKPEPLPDIEVVDLKHLPLTDIEERFEDSRPELQRIFDRFCKGQMVKVERPCDMSEFACNYLLDEQQRLHMMDVITHNFGGPENLGKYDDLFWIRMQPEWCVALFMHTYKMTRPEATLRIAQQEKILQANFRMDDTMDDTLDEFVSTLRRNRK